MKEKLIKKNIVFYSIFASSLVFNSVNIESSDHNIVLAITSIILFVYMLRIYWYSYKLMVHHKLKNILNYQLASKFIFVSIFIVLMLNNLVLVSFISYVVYIFVEVFLLKKFNQRYDIEKNTIEESLKLSGKQFAERYQTISKAKSNIKLIYIFAATYIGYNYLYIRIEKDFVYLLLFILANIFILMVSYKYIVSVKISEGMEKFSFIVAYMFCLTIIAVAGLLDLPLFIIFAIPFAVIASKIEEKQEKNIKTDCINKDLYDHF